jgi:hypothetical protein
MTLLIYQLANYFLLSISDIIKAVREFIGGGEIRFDIWLLKPLTDRWLSVRLLGSIRQRNDTVIRKITFIKPLRFSCEH